MLYTELGLETRLSRESFSPLLLSAATLSWLYGYIVRLYHNKPANHPANNV